MKARSKAWRPRRRWLAVAVGLPVVAALVVTATSGADRASRSATGLELAQALVTKITTPPKTIPVTKPHTKPIPKGKQILFIHCGAPTCTVIGDAIAEGARALGWKSSTIASGGTPEGVKGAWDTAVRRHPTAVLAAGWNRAGFESELQQLKKLKVGVFECCATDPPGNGIDMMLSGPADEARQGDYMAAWVSVETKGKANVLYVNLPEYVILAGVKDRFKSGMAKFCPGCPVDMMDTPIASAGKESTDKIVSYLRGHPDVNYVVLSQDSVLAPGLPAALKAAGLSDKVKFMGEGGSSIISQYIQSGQETASVIFPVYEFWWTMVDAVARKVNGEPLAQNKILTPFFLLTKANMKSTAQNAPITPNLKAQFKKLWGKG